MVFHEMPAADRTPLGSPRVEAIIVSTFIEDWPIAVILQLHNWANWQKVNIDVQVNGQGASNCPFHICF